MEKVGRKQAVEFIAWRRESIYKWCCVGGLRLMKGLEDKEKKASDTQMDKHGVCVCGNKIQDTCAHCLCGF